MISREKYIVPIRDFYKSDLIKIITGIRRCGKSVILKQVMDEISTMSSNLIYLNFENAANLPNIKNGDDLIDYVLKKKKRGLCYVFLDEVQTIDGWQLACKTLRLNQCSVFITGSNSKLLSSEFTKELSGRYVSFRVRPFVYKEILKIAKEKRKKITVSDYLIWGGFPNRFYMKNQDAQNLYLNDLKKTIVINDLANRYGIRKRALFESLVAFVLRSNSRIFSAKAIRDYVKQEHDKCSVNTIMKYIAYLKEAYVICGLPQYSTKVKRELSFYEKIYNEDVALNSIYASAGRYDITHNLENIVYNELVYMGYELFVYNNKGKEIDFLAQKGNKKYLIQVAYSVAEEKAYAREFSAFNGVEGEFQKIIITNDDVDYSSSTVRHIMLKEFLMMDSLEIMPKALTLAEARAAYNVWLQYKKEHP